jgi:uncharacterized protein
LSAVSARLSLTVSPGAARSAVVGRHGAGWKVRIAAAPEHGKANAALVRLLSDVLAVPARTVEIVSGHASREKTIELAGLDHDEAERRLAGAAAGRKERT